MTVNRLLKEQQKTIFQQFIFAIRIQAGSPEIGTPALRLFITAAEQVGEAAGDIIHLSLLGGNIAVAVYIEGRMQLPFMQYQT